MSNISQFEDLFAKASTERLYREKVAFLVEHVVCAMGGVANFNISREFDAVTISIERANDEGLRRHSMELQALPLDLGHKVFILERQGIWVSRIRVEIHV